MVVEVNMFITENKPFSDGLFVVEYDIENEATFTKLYKGSALWGKVNLLCDILLNKYNVISHFYVHSPFKGKYKPVIYVVNLGNIRREYPDIMIDQRSWKIVASGRKRRIAPGTVVGDYIIEGIVRRLLYRRARELGFVKDGRRYVDYRKTEEVFVKDKKLWVRRGFTLDIEVFKDGDVGIWLDIVHRLSQPLSDILYDSEGKLKPNYRELIKELIKEERTVFARTRKQRVISAKISKFVDKSNKDFVLQTAEGKLSLFNYWKKYYASDEIGLLPEDHPVLGLVPLVGPPRILWWPIRCFDFRKNSYEPVIFLNPVEEEMPPRSLSPGKRRMEILNFASKLISKPIVMGDIRLKFREANGEPMLARPLDLINEKKILFSEYLSDWIESPQGEVGPLLRFNRGVTRNIIKGLQRFYPILGYYRIHVVGVVPERRIQDFIKFIKIFNESITFCDLEYDPNEIEVIRLKHRQKISGGVESNYIVDSYSDGSFNASRKLQVKLPPRTAIVVIPRSVRIKELYYTIKKEFYSQGFIPHIIREETLDKILKGERHFPILLNIAAAIYYNSVQEIYLKKLNRYEKPQGITWILDKPAGYSYGGCEETVYMGFDVSSHPEFGEKYGVTVTLCDSHGRLVYVQSKATEDYLQYERMKMIFDYTFKIIERKVKSLESLKRMVFYRDGVLLHTEKEAITYAAEEVIKRRGLSKDFKIDLISVPKSGEERIFEIVGNGAYVKYYNPRPGYAIALSNNQLILVTTKFYGRGWHNRTVKPLRIRYEGVVPRTSQRTDLKLISSEFLDLTMLDWGSTLFQPKLPIPLLLAHQISQMMAFTAGEYLKHPGMINI